MSIYRKKPVEIEAVLWGGSNIDEVYAFAEGNFHVVDPEDRIDDADITAEVFDCLHSTWVGVYTGQWIIRGIKGEYYPCAADVFDATYDLVTS